MQAWIEASTVTKINNTKSKAIKDYKEKTKIYAEPFYADVNRTHYIYRVYRHYNYDYSTY